MFLNSAFEDETMKLRQLKLDNQVSRGSPSERCGQLILARKPMGLTVAAARPKRFEDISAANWPEDISVKLALDL